MTTEETAEIKALRHARRLREEAEAATEPAIVNALRAGYKPSVISREAGVSDSYVRTLRRKNDIPADPRYAHLRPPTKNEESQS